MKKILFVFTLVATLCVYTLVNAQEAPFTKSLYFGMQGDPEITKLQEFLTDEGLYSGPITGNIFSLTVKGIKKFQEREGISPTGYFGVLTRARANEILAGQMQGSESQAIAETGTSTPIVEKPKTTNDVVAALQAQIQVLMQQMELLRQQQTTQREAGNAVKELQTQVVKQTEVIQQQNTTIQQIQQNTQQIQQNTTAPVIQPTPTPVVIGSLSAVTNNSIGTTINTTEGLNKKIGSYVISASSENINISTIKIDVGDHATTNFQKLKVMAGNTQIGQIQETLTNRGTYNFSGNLAVVAYGSQIVDIYADVQSGASGVERATTLSCIATGVSSGASITCGPTNGQMVSIMRPVTLVAADVTKVSSSAPTQLVTLGTNMPAVTYNIRSLTAPVTITEMTFNVAPDTNSIVALQVGGISKPTTALTGNIIPNLNIAVPAGRAGLNIPVQATFGRVNTNGGFLSGGGASATISLVSLKYISGDVIANLDLTTAPTTLMSNGMQLVASKPSLMVDGMQKTGLILGTENKIGEITVIADARGNIKVNKMVFNFGFSGFSTNPSITSPRIADGSMTISGTNTTVTTETAATAVFGSASLTDGDGYSIDAGTSKTFSLHATINGGVVASGATASISSQVQGTTNFSWDDANGGGTNLNAVNIYNFPTQSYSLRQ